MLAFGVANRSWWRNGVTAMSMRIPSPFRIDVLVDARASFGCRDACPLPGRQPNAGLGRPLAGVGDDEALGRGREARPNAGKYAQLGGLIRGRLDGPALPAKRQFVGVEVLLRVVCSDQRRRAFHAASLPTIATVPRRSGGNDA